MEPTAQIPKVLRRIQQPNTIYKQNVIVNNHTIYQSICNFVANILLYNDVDVSKEDLQSIGIATVCVLTAICKISFAFLQINGEM